MTSVLLVSFFYAFNARKIGYNRALAARSFPAGSGWFLGPLFLSASSAKGEIMSQLAHRENGVICTLVPPAHDAGNDSDHHYGE